MAADRVGSERSRAAWHSAGLVKRRAAATADPRESARSRAGWHSAGSVARRAAATADPGGSARSRAVRRSVVSQAFRAAAAADFQAPARRRAASRLESVPAPEEAREAEFGPRGEARVVAGRAVSALKRRAACPDAAAVAAWAGRLLAPAGREARWRQAGAAGPASPAPAHPALAAGLVAACPCHRLALVAGRAAACPYHRPAVPRLAPGGFRHCSIATVSFAGWRRQKSLPCKAEWSYVSSVPRPVGDRNAYRSRTASSVCRLLIRRPQAT